MEQAKQEKQKTAPITWLILILFCTGIVFVFNNATKDLPAKNQVSNTPVSRCLSVPETVSQRLNDGLNINGGGSITNLKAVKSNDFASVYFISGELNGAGLEGAGDIATFVMNRLDTTSLTLSADTVASEFSDWPNISTTNLGVSIGDDGYDESRRCVTS